MSDSLYHFPVRDEATGQEVRVELRSTLTTRDFIDLERVWHPARLDILARLDAIKAPQATWPESYHWNWNQKASQLGLLLTTTYAVWSSRGPEAVMMVQTVPYEARLSPDIGKPLVYIGFIEVAPWNWAVTPINQVPALKGLGSQLIRVAMAFSMDEGFKGRVGLHSLPQSEAWYVRRGFTKIGPDRHKEGLVYLELASDEAQKLLSTT